MSEHIQISSGFKTITALRPDHWVKNLLVYAAPLFALEFTLDSLLYASSAFISFSLVSSGFYLINDIVDVERDRKHPIKWKRAIASGQLSISSAQCIAIRCLTIGLVFGFWVNVWLGIIITMYAILQLSYNLVLKKLPILDILTIATGFVLRAVSGGVVTRVPVSSWFILCVGLLALFLGVGKRKAELRLQTDYTRRVLQDYSESWLNRMEGVATAGALITYSLWTIEGAENPWMLLTVPIVIYAIFHYQYLSESAEVEAPEQILVKDVRLMLSICIWIITSLVILLIQHHS